LARSVPRAQPEVVALTLYIETEVVALTIYIEDGVN
jgi:hypothetical protein